ncbi:bactericidal permeability-increasing protein-like [Trichosurus vulpecula]|uniref:bactericidal permeability-increasing protein-like n=1 Tax=Trichosurus vulpecula TaxID=9337 RepID=UPI00186AD7B6|nr:bactericidal permeability-increasing protein-like [Trichosurus vulpecula]
MEYTLVQNAPRAQGHPKISMSQKMCIRLMMMAAMAVVLEGKKMPGIVIRISQKGLDHVSKQGTELIQKELLKIPLLIQMGLGDYELIRMMISKFVLQKSHISAVPKGFLLSMTDGLIIINGKWTNEKAKNNHIPFDLKLDGVSIRVTFKLGKNNKDQMSISVLSCIIHIGSVNIFTSTNQSLLRDVYEKNFQTMLHKNMFQKICSKIKTLTAFSVEPYLHTVPVKVNLDEIAGIDYSLIEPPKFKGHHLDIPLKGQFFSLTHHHTPYPFHPSAVDFRNSQLQMVFIGVSNSFFDSANHVYKNAGIKSLQMNSSMVPKDSKYILSTDYYGILIPQLSKDFPSMAMKIVVDFPASVPTIFIDSRTKLSLMSSLSTHVFAIFSNSSETLLFTLRLKTIVTLYIKVKSGTILGRMTLESLDVELEQSYIGHFQVSLMQDPFAYYISKVWLPIMNERLEQGYPLPVPTNLHFSDYIVYPHKVSECLL